MAIAHSLLIIIWHMLNEGTVYTDIGVDCLVGNDNPTDDDATSSTSSNTSATKSNSPPPPNRQHGSRFCEAGL